MGLILPCFTISTASISSAMDTYRDPWISIPLDKTNSGSTLNVGFTLKTSGGRYPKITSLPPVPKLSRLASNVSEDATKSKTASTPFPSVNLLASLDKLVSLQSMISSAPNFFASSSFSMDRSAASTRPPHSFAICTAWIPTPPPAPTIKMSSPGQTCASSLHACKGVATASEIIEASTNGIPLGRGQRLSAGTLMYSA